MEFFKSYCREFNDEDENQLKHTEIYQSYMKILDEMIDAKLVQSFDDLQTEGFYKSFKDNQALTRRSTMRFTKLCLALSALTRLKKKC